MKRITNTINNDIEVQIFGETYVLKAKGTLDVSKEVAEYWVKNLHSFLEVSNVPEKEVKVEVKEVVSEVEEVVEKTKKTNKK